MAVFTFRFMDELREGVERIALPLLNSCSLVLSPDEFIDAFIDPSHVQLLKQTQQVVGRVTLSSVDQKYLLPNFSKALVKVEFGNDDPPIIIPSYIANGLVPTSSREVRQKINEWLLHRYEIGRIFGDSLDIIHWLNEECSNVASMALYFPAIRTIIENCIRYPDQAQWEKIRPRLAAKPRKLSIELPKRHIERIAECSRFLIKSAERECNFRPPLPRMHAELQVVAVTLREDDFIRSAFGVAKKASFI